MGTNGDGWSMVTGDFDAACDKMENVLSPNSEHSCTSIIRHEMKDWTILSS